MSATPQPYDGYVTEVECGYQVAADGVIVEPCVREYETARTLLSERCATKPRWYVSKTGGTTRIG